MGVSKIISDTSHTMPVYKIKLQFFNDVHKIEFDTEQDVEDFQDIVGEFTGVAPQFQKLKFGRKLMMPNDLETFEGWAGIEDLIKGSTSDYAYKITVCD